MDNIHAFHGVVFVRRGFYRDGVFRFTLRLPDNYNSENSYPIIHFVPPIFNPAVNPMTGELKLCHAPGFERWLPSKHFLRNALLQIKKIFYEKSFADYLEVANVDAKQMSVLELVVT